MTRASMFTLLLLTGCSATGAPPAPTISTGPLSWKISETSTSFSATGKAPVQISDNTHAYLVLFRVYWDRKLNPADAPDTMTTLAIIVPGLHDYQQATLSAYKTRCSEYSGSDCIRGAADPSARLELVGWTRFERP